MSQILKVSLRSLSVSHFGNVWVIQGLVGDLAYVAFIYFFQLPVEPHLCHPFSGEAWLGPVPQEKDGPSPLLRWSLPFSLKPA